MDFAATTTEAEERSPFKVLIADDDKDVIVSGRFLLEDEGFVVLEATNPTVAAEVVKNNQLDAALVDMNYDRNTTSGQEGLGLIKKLQEIDPDLPIIVMTAWGTIELAISAMKRGAADFIQKPWENTRLLQLAKSHSLACRTVRRNRLLEEENRLLRSQSLPRGFVCQSEPMQRIMHMVKQVAPSGANILLLGENGTGKGVMAGIIHEHSPRKDGPFISVNTGGLPENLFESEMFGHVKGAFTDARSDRAGRVELASKGTLFLDEIANMTMAQQSRLLRLLETGEYERVGSSRTLKAEVRIIAATNANLHEAVRNGSFREDLFFRLNTVTIALPPLRERKSDILPLARSFVKKFAKKYNKTIDSLLGEETEKALLSHLWPGNIRELSHALERGVLMSQEGQIEPSHLALAEQRKQSSRKLEEMSIEEVEQVLIRKALERNEGNVTRAAEQLGMSRATFYRRLKTLESKQ